MNGFRPPALGERGEGWVALQLVALAAVATSALAPTRWPLPARAVRRLSGGALLMAGVAELAVATRALGPSLTPWARPRPGAELAEDSIYGVVRHPIYGGLLLGSAGWSLLASPTGLIPTALLAVVLHLKARLEESWLEESFPAYPAYRRAVPRRFVPGLV